LHDYDATKRDDITEANPDVGLVDMGVSLNEIFVALWKGKWIILMTLMVYD
jgi:LPS O-antigen subunit length determinant protein (WzzB/FepE family)